MKYFKYLRQEKKCMQILFFIFFSSPTSQSHPCRDRLTIEYNECALMHSQKWYNTLNGLSNKIYSYSWSCHIIVSSQMTLTADELFVHKICVTYDIETILDQICQVSFQYHKLHRFYGKSAHQLLRSSEMTQLWVLEDLHARSRISRRARKSQISQRYWRVSWILSF